MTTVGAAVGALVTVLDGGHREAFHKGNERVQRQPGKGILEVPGLLMPTASFWLRGTEALLSDTGGGM